MRRPRRPNRKPLSVLLVLCMVLTLVPVTALAAGNENEGGGSSIYTHAYHTKIEATVITKVDIGNIWKTLDASQPVPFTAEVNPDSECAEQMEIVDECWSSESTTNGHTTQTIRKSDEMQQKPMVDETYSYGVTLRAKEGYVFDETQAPVFICDGKIYTGRYIPSPSTDYKQALIYFQDITSTAIDSSKPAGVTIDAVDISNVKFNYQVGDVPQATADLVGEFTDEYEIEYEYWEEMIEHSGAMLPVKYWYSDEAKNNALKSEQKITMFEEGKTYMYSVSLKAKDGNTFVANCPVTVNGSTVRDANVTNMGTGLFVTAVKTIKPKAPVIEKPIEVVEINGVTTTFKVGDKPVFTGKVPDGANYAYRCEWWELDSKTGLVSTEPEWGSGIYENKITAFEAGKTYHYGLYVTAVGYVEDENVTYIFTPETKLKINGEFVNYKRYEGDASDGSDGTMWVLTDLTMTPESSGMAPEYKVIEGANGTWKQNSDGTLTFRANGEFSKFTGVKVDGQLVDAKNYTAVSGSTIVTLSADYLKTLSTGNHTLTVLFNDGDCSTNFTVQVAGSSTTPSNPGSGTGSGTTPSNPNGGTSGSATTPSGSNGTTGAATTAGGTKVTGTNTANLNKAPKTGEDSPLALWIGVLCVSAFGMVGTTIYSRKKKYTK